MGAPQNTPQNKAGVWGAAATPEEGLNQFIVVCATKARVLDCSIDSYWLVGFLVWFVVGPGDFREGPGSPRTPGPVQETSKPRPFAGPSQAAQGAFGVGPIRGAELGSNSMRFCCFL